METKLHIIGAGGHAKVIVDIIFMNNQTVNGVWDDDLTRMLFHMPVSGTVDELIENDDNLPIIIAIGRNAERISIANRLGVRTYGTIIHPSSVVSTFSKIGCGVVLMANTTINASTKIGDHTIINTNCSVDHDCIVGAFVHLSPHVAIAGNVTIGYGSHLGTNATVLPGVQIGKFATIGAGAVVVKDVPDYAVVIGNPGRIIKYNTK